jgi:hypothetical protein
VALYACKNFHRSGGKKFISPNHEVDRIANLCYNCVMPVTGPGFKPNYKHYQRLYRARTTDLPVPPFSRLGSKDIIPYIENTFYKQRNWYLWTMGEQWFNRQVERFIFLYQSTGHPDAGRAHFSPAIERVGLELEQFSRYIPA